MDPTAAHAEQDVEVTPEPYVEDAGEYVSSQVQTPATPITWDERMVCGYQAHSRVLKVLSPDMRHI